MLIDHLVYAAPDLPAAVAGLQERFGVRARAGGRHTGRGTRNVLLALGARTYLEIIAPDPGQPGPPAPRPFGLDGRSRGGLAGWALACDDIDAAIARARSRGYDPGEAAGGQRTAPGGTVLRWRATLNATAGGLIPFLISWGDTTHPVRSAPRGLTLEAFHLEHPDPPRSRRCSPPSARTSRSGPRPRPRSSPASAARTAATCCGDHPWPRTRAAQAPGADGAGAGDADSGNDSATLLPPPMPGASVRNVRPESILVAYMTSGT